MSAASFDGSARLARVVAAVATLAAAGAAVANDSTASLGAGGLVLERTAAVAMAEEVLEIRPDRVQVRYRFVNRSARDVETLVAFPLPAVSADYREDPGFDTRRDAANFVGFTAMVDGRAVPLRAELRAYAGTREVTGLLREAGVPVSLFDMRLDRALEGLARPQRARLAAARAILSDADPAPQWTMQARLYWQQRFPAGRTVAVAHDYRPVAGLSMWSPRELLRTDAADEHCLDPGARAALTRRSAGDESLSLLRTQVDYILSTARNWAGPVGAFTLVVDSNAPDVVALACFEGMTRVSPGRLEVRLADFVPQRDLKVVFLAVRSPDAPDAPADGPPQGRFPEASQRPLGESDLAGLSLAELRLMRNEIFARRGYIFRREDLRRHFAAQPWYRPRFDDVTAQLAPVERANLQAIQARERALTR